jgi:hypothetical protein
LDERHPFLLRHRSLGLGIQDIAQRCGRLLWTFLSHVGFYSRSADEIFAKVFPVNQDSARRAQSERVHGLMMLRAVTASTSYLGFPSCTKPTMHSAMPFEKWEPRQGNVRQFRRSWHCQGSTAKETLQIGRRQMRSIRVITRWRGLRPDASRRSHCEATVASIFFHLDLDATRSVGASCAVFRRRGGGSWGGLRPPDCCH